MFSFSGSYIRLKILSKLNKKQSKSVHNLLTRQYCKPTSDYSRTSTTCQLWAKRAEILRKHKPFPSDSESTTAPDMNQEPFLLVKKPSDSFVEINYPFSSNKSIRDEYVNIYGNIRFGKILEDLDAMAGNIANIHADDNNPSTRPLNLVTASLDRMDLLSKMELNNDMRMCGNVSYAGTSSIEVRIVLETNDKIKNQWQTLLLSTFTMVALSNGKPVPVNKISPETENEKLLFQLGQGKYELCSIFIL